MSGRSFKIVVRDIGGSMGAIVDYGDKQEIFSDIQYNTYQYAPGSEIAEHLIKTMADNGTKTFGFMVSLAEYPQRWTDPLWRYNNGENVYDFSQIDKRIEMTLKYCPEAKIILRIFVGVDQVWLTENPDERVITLKSDGTFSHRYDYTCIANPGFDYVSMASHKWRAAAGEAFAAAVSHTEQKYGDHVIAYCISGLSSEEWYHHGWHSDSLDDYSAPMKNAFRSWVLRKYNTETALRDAWNKPLGYTFEDIQIPLHDRRISNLYSTFYNLPDEKDVVDFYIFYNEVIPDTISSFASYAKKAAPDKLIGALYAYQLEFGEICSGHHRLGKFLEITDIDYILVETGYVRRHAAKGGDNIRNPFTSIKLHKKLNFNDNDTATYKFDQIHPPTPLKETYRDQLGVSNDPETSGEVIKRIVGFAMGNGFATTFFDLHGGYYDDPIILKKAQEAEDVYREHYKYSRKSAAEVLMVFDEKSDMYVRVCNIEDGNKFLRTQLTVMSSSSVKLCCPFDAVLLEDLHLLDISQYKLIIIVNTYALTKAEIDIIEKTKGGGRTIVFGYAPSIIVDDIKDVSQVSKLVGMNIVEGINVSETNYFFDPCQEAYAKTFYDNTREEVTTGIMSGYRYGQYSVLIKPQKLSERSSYTVPGSLCTEMWVDDKNATTIASTTLKDGREVTSFAYRKFSENGGYTTIYCNTLAVSSIILRTFAKLAGVTIYSDYEDTIFANDSIITLHAYGDGKRTITLPKKCSKVFNMITGEIIAQNTKQFKLTMSNAHTIYMRMEI